MEAKGVSPPQSLHYTTFQKKNSYGNISNNNKYCNAMSSFEKTYVNLFSNYFSIT